MQDIDFDELDRAVASTMTPQDSSVEPQSDAATPAPEDKKPAPAARRSSGRFMDVVHPSSDMRTSSAPVRSAPRDPELQSPIEPEKADTSMPDPLDFHGFTMDDTPPTPVEADESKDETATPSPESPFLPDAKVEKRPLGGFSEAEPTKEEMPLLEAPDEERIPATVEDVPVAEPVSEPTPEVEPETPAPTEESAPITAEEPSNIPASITPQYKEHPSSEAPTGPMFDTESYHQALVHAPAKKSGALIIVWIIALIVLGAAGGAVAYFFVLPLL